MDFLGYLPTFEEIESGGVLLSWGDVFGWVGLVFLLVVLPLVLAAALRRRWVWPMLIIVNIIGIGPLVKGYAILDEVFTYMIVIGCLMLLTLQNRQGQEVDRDRVDALEEKRRWVFELWTGYVVLQSVLGILVNNDPRLVRWVLMYAMFAVLSRIVSRRSDFPFPSLRGAALIVLSTTILYYLVYLGQGVYWDLGLLDPGLLSEAGRFQFQHYWWSGSSSATFPTLVATPAALLLLEDKSLRVRGLAWSGLILMTLIAFYYDSVVSFLVIGLYGLVSLYRLQVRQVVIVGISFFALYFLFVPRPLENLGDFVGRLVEQATVLSWAPSDNYGAEIRRLQVKGSLMAATDDLRSLIFGAGYYSHRYVLVPYMRQIWAESLPSMYYDQYNVVSGTKNDPFTMTVFRTMALPALLIDTGLVGVMLFAANFVLAAVGILKRGGSNRYLFTAALFAGFMWLLASHIMDIVLLHLVIMPGGLIYQMSRASMREARQVVRKGHVVERRGETSGVMSGGVIGSEAR